MQDPRLDRLAGLFLEHSLKVDRGQAYFITADIQAIPLVRAILRKSRSIGAFAQVQLIEQGVNRLMLELLDPNDGGASERFLNDKTQAGLRQFENLVGNIVIRAYENDQELAKVPSSIKQLAGQLGKPLNDFVTKEKRWVLFEYPTPGQAQRAGLSFDDYFDFVLAVSCVDYGAMARNTQPLKELMEKTDHVQVKGPGTDLSFSIKGMPAIACCGENNIPDGECFTAPIRDSVQGFITYNTPSIYWGYTFNQVRLEFADGRIVNASAAQSAEHLDEILNCDEGARFIGEFAIGLNPLIREPFCNTLFDEKICGSLHFTPGLSIDEATNGNDSAIHWDLVQIQRPEYGGGEIWFDGKLVRKDGRFTIPELAGLNGPKE